MLDSIRNKQFKFFIKDLKNLALVSQNLLLVIQKMYFKNNIFLIKKDKKSLNILMIVKMYLIGI